MFFRKSPFFILYVLLVMISGSVFSSEYLPVQAQEKPESQEEQVEKKKAVVVPPSAPRRSNTLPPKIVERTSGQISVPVSKSRPDSVLPEGTIIEVRMAENVSTDKNLAGDPFEAILDRDLPLSNQGLIPKGTRVTGRVLESIRPGKVKGKAEMSISLDSILVGENEYSIVTNKISFEAEATKGEDAQAVGISTAVGAAIGAIFGGGKGAAVGAAGGAGAGTAGVLLSKGREIELEKERLFSFRLEKDVIIESKRPNP